MLAKGRPRRFIKIRLKNQQIKKRYCYKCGGEIDKREFLREESRKDCRSSQIIKIGRPYAEFSYNQKQQIWNNELFALLCCACLRLQTIESFEYDIFDSAYYKNLSLKNKIKYFNPNKAKVKILDDFIVKRNKINIWKRIWNRLKK